MSNLKQAQQNVQSSYFNKKQNSMMTDLSNYKKSNKVTYSNLDVSNVSMGFLPDDKLFQEGDNDILQQITEQDSTILQEFSVAEADDTTILLQSIFKSQMQQTDLDQELLRCLNEYLYLCGEQLDPELNGTPTEVQQSIHESDLSISQNTSNLKALDSPQHDYTNDLELTDDKSSLADEKHKNQLNQNVKDQQLAKNKYINRQLSSNGIISKSLTTAQQQTNKDQNNQAKKTTKQTHINTTQKKPYQQKEENKHAEKQNTKQQNIQKAKPIQHNTVKSQPQKQQQPLSEVHISIQQKKKSSQDLQNPDDKYQQNAVMLAELAESYNKLINSPPQQIQRQNIPKIHSIKFYKKNQVPLVPNENIIVYTKKQQRIYSPSSVIIDKMIVNNNVPQTNKQIRVNSPAHLQETTSP